MLASKIKDKLQRGEVSLGSWMSLAHVSNAEILANAGYDWVAIEIEHTAIAMSEALRLIIAIEGRGAAPLVRMAGIDPLQAKAALDSGAAGVLVPLVNTKADAELSVKMTKYPPLGFRGMGVARAHGYGQSFDEYVRRANDDTLLIVQIEHIDAVWNIEEILSVPGIDGTFIGPYDLSASLGIPGQVDHADVQGAKQRVLEATLARGLTAGIHLLHPSTAVENLRQCVAQGYRFIALGSDIMFLGESCRTLHAAAKDILAEMGLRG
jgi:2-dehydro-3-deoxyglucarate aldolase